MDLSRLWARIFAFSFFIVRILDQTQPRLGVVNVSALFPGRSRRVMSEKTLEDHFFFQKNVIPYTALQGSKSGLFFYDVSKVHK